MTCTARTTLFAGIGRMLTTIGPLSRPAGWQAMVVRYIGTLWPSSMCLTGTPLASSAASKLKLQPMRKATMSSSQKGVMSCTS